MDIQIQIAFGAISSSLLGVVANLLRQLHTYFKQMERDLNEVKTTTKLIKSEFKSGFDLLTQRVEFLEKRVDMLERNEQG